MWAVVLDTIDEGKDVVGNAIVNPYGAVVLLDDVVDPLPLKLVFVYVVLLPWLFTYMVPPATTPPMPEPPDTTKNKS